MSFTFWIFGTDMNPLNQDVANELRKRGIRTVPISGIYYEDAAKMVLKETEKPPDLLIFGDDSNHLSWLHGTAQHMQEHCHRTKCVVVLAKPTHPLPFPLRGYAETQHIFTHRNAIQETVDWIVRTFIEMVRGA
jgi:predicted ThiF/HesA family dinucleotide-utilizing enzyme